MRFGCFAIESCVAGHRCGQQASEIRVERSEREPSREDFEAASETNSDKVCSCVLSFDSFVMVIEKVVQRWQWIIVHLVEKKKTQNTGEPWFFICEPHTLIHITPRVPTARPSLRGCSSTVQ